MCTNLYNHYDFLPTLVDFLNLETDTQQKSHLAALPGRSFAKALVDGETADDSPVIIYSEYGPTRMIRTSKYKLVKVDHDGEDAFYDLVNDPGETDNVIGQERYSSEIAKLEDQLQAWFNQYALPQHDCRSALNYGGGQTAPMEEGCKDVFIRDDSVGRDYMEYANEKNEQMRKYIEMLIAAQAGQQEK